MEERVRSPVFRPASSNSCFGVYQRKLVPAEEEEVGQDYHGRGKGKEETHSVASREHHDIFALFGGMWAAQLLRVRLLAAHIPVQDIVENFRLSVSSNGMEEAARHEKTHS